MPGLALQWRFYALGYHTPRAPCLRFCRGNGDLFQSRESTFAGLIFLGCRGDEWVHLTDTPPNSLGPSAGKSGGFKLSWGGGGPHSQNVYWAFRSMAKSPVQSLVPSK